MKVDLNYLEEQINEDDELHPDKRKMIQEAIYLIDSAITIGGYDPEYPE